jgi:hypothetical protein
MFVIPSEAGNLSFLGVEQREIPRLARNDKGPWGLHLVKLTPAIDVIKIPLSFLSGVHPVCQTGRECATVGILLQHLLHFYPPS